jgi:hypothetical protein
MARSLTRRELLGCAGIGILAPGAAAEVRDRIEGIEHRGMLIRESSLPGERRADDVIENRIAPSASLRPLASEFRAVHRFL